jgi:hypothetical protein
VGGTDLCGRACGESGGGRPDWAIDTIEAVGAEVGAALRISPGLAVSRVREARAMRERLPKVGEVFKAGDIDYRAFQAIVYRTDLITDPDVLRRVHNVGEQHRGQNPIISHVGLLSGSFGRC